MLKWYIYLLWRNTCKAIIREAKVVYILYWTMFLAPIIFYIAKKLNVKRNNIINGIAIMIK